MEYNFREETYKEILERGILNMANPLLAEEYVKELIARGHDIYVVHAIGTSGIRDIIFKKEKASLVMNMMLSRRNELTDMLEKVESAISFIEGLE
jgi:hypothetical protein